jgi:ornithine cyclodeaminase/alanine dehydrogenase-like protein (mu-crystallin family)
MRVISAAEIDQILTFPVLVEALRQGFASDITVPLRHHHAIERAGSATATHLLMSAWTNDAAGKSFLGTKIVNVFPDNGKRGLPSIYGIYLLMSGQTGETLAAMDGTRLTAWRTAATSALAASYLASPVASRMVMVGAGALAPFLIRAHAGIRPLRHVSIWNQNPERARRLALELAPELQTSGLVIEAVEQLEPVVRMADLVSCATLSSQPLVQGHWLKPGAHLDLVGAYNPAMRESDDECVRRARIVVDTRAGALKEGGDIAQPLADGIINKADILAELAELCRGDVVVDRKPGDITLFKSVGAALEDLVAAMLVWRQLASS